jgi:hypothetical protein
MEDLFKSKVHPQIISFFILSHPRSPKKGLYSTAKTVTKKEMKISLPKVVLKT